MTNRILNLPTLNAFMTLSLSINLLFSQLLCPTLPALLTVLTSQVGRVEGGCFPLCMCPHRSSIACTERSWSNDRIPEFTSGTSRHIEQMTIKHQNITHLSRATAAVLRFLPNLEQLSITDCNIHTLQPRTFAYRFSNFVSLDLSRNRLREVPSMALMGLQNATEIRFSNNLITRVDANLFGTSVIRPRGGRLSLKFNSNLIRVFPSQFVENVEGFLRIGTRYGVDVDIDLSDNPIRCDCSIAWLVQMKLLHVTVEGTCSYDPETFPELMGTSLSRLDPKSFKDCSQMLSIFDFSLLSMQTLIISIVALVVCIILLICLYNRLSECIYERRTNKAMHTSTNLDTCDGLNIEDSSRFVDPLTCSPSRRTCSPSHMTSSPSHMSANAPGRYLTYADQSTRGNDRMVRLQQMGSFDEIHSFMD